MKNSKLLTLMLLLFTSFSFGCTKEKLVVGNHMEVIGYDKNQLVNHSDIIMEGIVISQEVQEDFTGYPATDTVLKVTKVYMGTPGDTVEIRVIGGETDKMIYLPDADLLPSFEIGEEVLVFLINNRGFTPDSKDFGYYVVGQYQGKFSLTGNDKIMNKAFEFNLSTFKEELETIIGENKTLNLPKNYNEDGKGSDI